MTRDSGLSSRSLSPLTRLLLRLRFQPQVFRKYSHALGPDVLDFLEGVLDKHEIADEDVEYSIDLIAKEYNKQDGRFGRLAPLCPELTPLPLVRRSDESIGRGVGKSISTLTGIIHYRELYRTRYPRC